ncbi:MAG: ribonucleoside-triphosphate reductase, adenosylcobalamin-dependent [Hormoscilla sp. GM7CHS1pb]|nr:ribonucleoside-triphosphate reductase, adenosylcobalamin-dependent [Hormoscilla sp. GM7CHS1pb]
MVQQLERKRQTNQFPPDAPVGFPVFFRTYSQRTAEGKRESWKDVCDRAIAGLTELGKLTPEESNLLYRMQMQLKALSSGRWLWIGGTEWIKQPENFPGAYNCSSTNILDWRSFGLLMDLAMMGCGTGAVLEPRYINQLPPIRNHLKVKLWGKIGATSPFMRREETEVKISGNKVIIHVGDSRQGWVASYQSLLELSTEERFTDSVEVDIDLSDVRPAGEPLKGFGGVANPVKLPDMYQRCAGILNKAVGRQLNSVECSLLIDEAAVTIVAGNIRRCIAYGERVSAISGMKPIQDVTIGELVLTSSGQYKPVTNKFVQGVQDVVEIRTRETAIRCTANHRVAVYNGLQSYTWKYAGELQPGDRLISVPHRKGMLCSTTDYAWLVGFFIGDGHADIASLKRRNRGGGSVTFAFSSERLNGPLGQKCLRILKSLGYTPGMSWSDNHAYIKVHRKDLADELIQYKQPWETPIIPEFVWLGTEDIRGAFLAGLADADAGPSRNVLLHSNKIEFLRQVQRLSLSLGIATKLHERSPKMLKGRDTVYEGCHWLKIRGIQSQVNAVALVNPHMGREGFRIYGQKKNGLSLPHQFIEEAMAAGWRAKTVSRTKSIVNSGRPGFAMRDANWDTLLAEGVVNPHWLPLEVQLVVPAGQAETFDIEVESDREFIASGLLVHNSAGMRQGASDDATFAVAKDNLWQQDENGNWRIDPDRDALRMANHTRIFHHKPTLEECIAAVRKQYYSGEGAIMWAGESVARANGDLLPSREQKTDFLRAYSQGKSREWLQERYPNIAPEELEHRLARVGLNPCLSDDTWILTENGAQKIKDLLGKQVGLFVNGELFSTTKEGFYETGVKRLYRLTTKEGYEIRATDNHPFLKITAQTQKKQYSEWTELKDLSVGDRVSIHNHKGIQPWCGDGTFGEGWLLGSLVGDGNFSVSEKHSKQTAVLRYWGDNQAQMSDYAAMSGPCRVPRDKSTGKTSKALIKEELGSQLTAIAYPCNQYTQVRGSFPGAPTLSFASWQRHGWVSPETIGALYKLAKRFGMKQRCLDRALSLGTRARGRHRSHKTVTPAVERASYDFYRGFLQGFFDADGSVEGGQQGGVSVRLYQSDLNALKAVQRMLLRLGIASKLYQHRPERRELLPDGKGGQKLYNCKAAHELSVSRANLKEFHAIVGFSDPDKKAKLDALLCKQRFGKESFTVRVSSIEFDGIEPVYDCTVPGVSRFDANGFVVHNCGEIVGANFFCNLSEIHLNQIDPHNYQEQADAFTAGALSVATLLNHKFVEPRYRDSRELDPIVGVSFTGLFDFFVNAFGVDWLHWWKEGRPELHGGLEYKQREIEYLSRWKEIVHRVVWDYCDRHSLKCPNRCTTCQPSGTKSLLTGASPGWHPPKAQRFIRRVTFAKNDPVALACIDYGYNVVPSQSDKDENGNLLHDPFSPLCSEWLVEIPVAVPWADLPGADAIDIAKFSAIAQMDFYLTVQRYWTTHNSSATIELRENEIEALGTRIYEAIALDEGYISAALLARFDDHQSFPRLPFEPIDKQQYDLLMKEVQMRRQTDDFQAALSRYDSGYAAVGPAGCDSDKCLFPSQRRSDEGS